MIVVISKDGVQLTMTNSPKSARKVVEQNVGSRMEIVNDY